VGTVILGLELITTVAGVAARVVDVGGVVCVYEGEGDMFRAGLVVSAGVDEGVGTYV